MLNSIWPFKIFDIFNNMEFERQKIGVKTTLQDVEGLFPVILKDLFVSLSAFIELKVFVAELS